PPPAPTPTPSAGSPIVDAGGPYQIVESASGALTASGTEPHRNTPAPPLAPRPMSPPVTTAAVAEAKTLDDLRTLVETFDGCMLRRTATRTVFGDGPANARLMVIGEAPGADEDRSGTPFVGRAGQLLNKMLASINWPREAVYITNVVPWRPPGNRNPTPEEITLCLPFVLRAIDLVAPSAILLLGASSAGAILNTTEGITRIRGRWHTLERPGLSIPVLPTFHPAFLLRFPDKKAFSWHDLLDLKSRIGTPPIE
ncbi:MAG: uracil-DNA glycosylase, partial [Methylothermaceae bacterium]|nr:uracil-DNA glycosylase [Methylothermaceae bacterium]